jgi:hypothetical protein
MAAYKVIEDISFCDGTGTTREELTEKFQNGYFSDPDQWSDPLLVMDSRTISRAIPSRLTKRMSDMSLGICYVMQEGPVQTLTPDRDIYLFTGFGEIETTRKIINAIKIDGDHLVSPTLFHNSVHNTPLGYCTIINKLHNYCTTITDGRSTTDGFINYLNLLGDFNQPAVITSGDEYSHLFNLDSGEKNEIVPFFTACTVRKGNDKGFRYLGCFDDINMVKDELENNSYDRVAGDIETFHQLQDEIAIPLLTDYPITRHNPVAIACRLALPFYLDIPGKTMVVQKSGDTYHCYEVLL